MIKERNKINWKDWIEGVLVTIPLRLNFKNKYLREIDYKLNQKFSWLLEKFLTFLNIAQYTDNYKLEKIPTRTACFIKEAENNNLKFEILKSKYGYSNYFKMYNREKVIYFEGLPIQKFSKNTANSTNNKEKTKKILEKNKIPTPKGNSFWFFQKKKALNYAKKLGFPLVVKPNSSSLSNGVSTNIKTIEELNKGINKALNYSPVFIIEKYFSTASDFRITVVNFNTVFCLKRIPAFVEGDGKHNILELGELENNKKERGEKRKIKTPFYKIKIDSDTRKTLKEQGFNFSSIPPQNKKVQIQNKPFLKLGGVPIDKTDKIHPDNIELFKKIARKIGFSLIGIDFLAEDISVSFKNQKCGIIEINDLPNLIIHRYPYKGKSRNISKIILNALKKEG